MKKQLITATMIVTFGLAVTGCGTQGVSGDVTATTVEQEMDMTDAQQMTEEVPAVEVTTEAMEATTEAAAEVATDVDGAVVETTAETVESTAETVPTEDEAGSAADDAAEATSETEAAEE